MRVFGFKKILALILALAVVFSAVQTVFAEAENGNFDAVGTSSDAGTPSDAATSTDADKIIARLSVCSSLTVPPFVGHTYIYVHNLSDNPIQVGLYEVPVGQGVSVGTFSFSVWDGWGLYYNVEAYRENRDGREGKVWSKSMDLTAEGLEKLSGSLKNYLNYWDFFFNCAFFAYTTWNGASGNFFIPLIIPAFSHLVIMIAGGEKGALDMYYPEEGQVFRQRGNGDSAWLEPVGNATLNT